MFFGGINNALKQNVPLLFIHVLFFALVAGSLESAN